MKLPDDLRRTISDVTERVVEKSQQLGKEAQLQVQLKKLQIEHAKKTHQLGKRVYDWHRSGTLIATMPPPTGIQELCTELDATQASIAATQREIEVVRCQDQSTPAAAGDA
jgi:hypothetical protein